MRLRTERLAEHTKAPPVTAECGVRVVSDYDSFLALEPVWNALVEEARIGYPFLRHEWVRTWWECFGEDHELYVLEVKVRGQTAAIAPLMLSHAWIYGLPVRRLALIGNAHTYRCDLIVTRQPVDAYWAIWDHLRSIAHRWDLLELSQVPAGSRTLDELPRLAARDGFQVNVRHLGDSPYIPLRGSWGQYVQGLRSKHRANLRNRIKRLNALGTVSVEEVSTPDRLAAALVDGFRIEAAAWKGRARSAIGSRPELRRFYTRLAERAVERGWLRLQFLTVNGRRIAFAYSLCAEDKLYLLKPGYEPAYAPFSPSHLLCYLVLQNAYASGLAEYDLLGVADDWKLAWTKDARPHYRLSIFPNRLRPMLLYTAKFRLVPPASRARAWARAALQAFRHGTAEAVGERRGWRKAPGRRR
ncbi:MAG TPA: GNAT family N-acetyltransferase [bacterium]|nr:GNAT family N-acetyltransferase [bacterium]